jgi:STE24 endopeptidase
MRATLRLPLAVGAALGTAAAGTALLRPRDLPPAPAPPPAADYFSLAELDRARRFRRGQRRLGLVAGAAALGVLGTLARRPPAALGALERRGGPLLAGAAAGAGVSLATGLAPLPVRALMRERARRVGLVTQGRAGWLADVARAQAIGAGFAGAGGALLVLARRRLGPRWWAAGAGGVTGFGVLTTLLGPVVLDPIFNRFTPLDAGELRDDVLELAAAAGVDVGEVFVVDASRRTTAANAYVTGLGRTKRVVLFDTLLRDFTPAEVRLVVAHELAHVAHRDVPHGLLWLALVAPPGMLAAAELAPRLAPAGASPALAVPAVALALSLLAPAVGAVANRLSRDVERRADAFALERTDDPGAFIAFQRRIALQNVGDPDPPRLGRMLFGTHPTTLERIAVAEAYARAA